MKPFEQRYTLRLPLGENDLGSIWTAQDNDSGASVAIVMLEEETGEAVRARFRDHAERLLGVSHPNVVRALDHGDTAEGVPYLVLELLEGESLAARFGQSALRVDRAVEWLAGAAEGLGALHAAGIAHGDVEPGNIFLAGESGKETAKIIGLALNRVEARTGSDAASRTSLTSLQQGYAYAAPEQLRGEVQASPAADLYSLGAVAYAVLAGRPPFVASDAESLLDAVRTKRPPALGAVKPELAGYATILDRALAAEPARRFADGAAFTRALKTCLLMSRATAALALPAGPRSPIGAPDAVEAAAATKPTPGIKASAAPKAAASPKPSLASKPFVAPRPLGARPLPAPARVAPAAALPADDAASPPTTAPEVASIHVSESETMDATVAASSVDAAASSEKNLVSQGERESIDVAVEVSERATIDAPIAPPAPPALDDVSEVTTVKGASTDAPEVVPVAPPALDDVSEVTTVKGTSSSGATASQVDSVPVVTAPALDDVSEVTTVKGASPVADEMELSEVSEVSEVSAVLIAPPEPPPSPRGDAPELAKPSARAPSRATPDAREEPSDADVPTAGSTSSRPGWLVPALLAAAALLGLGVWAATRGGAPTESVSDAMPEAVVPVATSPTEFAVEPDGVDTATPPAPIVAPEPPIEPAVVAEALDAGSPAIVPDVAPALAAPEPVAAVAAPEVAQAPAAPPSTAREPVVREPSARAPVAPARPSPARPSPARDVPSARPAAERAARPAPPASARSAQRAAGGRSGGRPTVISDPGF